MSITEVVLLLGLVVAQTAPTPAEEEIRTETRVLLQSLCGARCDVIAVRIKKRPVTPPGGVTPGFDDTPRLKLRPGQIDLTLLFDSKLDAAYRKFVADRVKQRISERGIPVLVTQDVRPFPEPPPIPKEPMAQAAPSPQPIVIQSPPPPSPEPEPVVEPPPVDLEEALWLKLIDTLPLALLLLALLLVFILLGWLVLRTLRRMEDLIYTAREPIPPPIVEDPPTVTPEIVEDLPEPVKVATVLPPPDQDMLIGDLQSHRGSTRRVFRRLLLKGEHDVVARSVAVLGDFVVRDLSHDPDVRKHLAAAGSRTAEVLRNPMTDDERIELLRIVQAELIADRVAHRAEDVRTELEPLLGWGPEAFAAMVARLDDRLSLVMLRHAPGHLTESYLKGLSPDARAQLVRKLMEDAAASPEELSTLADILDAQAQAALVGGYEADHIVDILDSLPAPEQDEVVTDLEQTRPDYVRRNLGQLPVESSLLRVPESALAVAWAQVPLDDWIQYLRSAPAEIRTRSLSACPTRLKSHVTDELALRVAPDPAKATRARRLIIQAALHAAPVALQGSAQGPSSMVKQGQS